MAAANKTPITRAIGADLLAASEVDFTRPVYLVKLLFPGQTRYVSTGIQVTFESDIYIEGQVSVKTFSWNMDGTQQGAIELSNEANAASALVLGATTNDIPIEIYVAYQLTATTVTVPQLYVSGVMDGGDVKPDFTTIQVVSTTARESYIPNRYHTALEGFNWLPVDGEVIVWGTEAFVLRNIS
jgi:hypothetical protein